MYVALDEATKQAPIDVIFARSFYAGAAHASGRLSGEILGVIGARDPEEIDEGLDALIRCLQHDACFYDADGKRGSRCSACDRLAREYLAKEAGLAVGRRWRTSSRRHSRRRSGSMPRSRQPRSAPCGSRRTAETNSRARG